MSTTSCQSGDTTGFPVRLAQSLHTNWPATKDLEQKLKDITVPTDFTVQWGPPTQSTQISVRQTTAKNGVPGVFQISGISTITDSTSLTYGNARYNCSGVLSIVQNQHPTFSRESEAQYEVILAFQIINKSYNPSSPDVILLCRPIIFSKTYNSSPFWSAVDEACAKDKPQNVALDMSTLFGYNNSILLPMITYQTCLPVKLLKYKSQPYSYGSLRMRVNVVTEPIYMVASENGLGKCSVIRKYTLVTLGSGPISVFNEASSNTILQFRDGFGKDLFPIQNTQENLVPGYTNTSITAFEDVIHTIEIQVPEAFLGKSLAEIADAKKLETVTPKKKAFKCYTVDPSKDIKGDQIMIDPTTGEPLKDILDKDAVNPDGTRITPTIKYVLYGKGITGDLPVEKVMPFTQNPGLGQDMHIFLAPRGNRINLVIARLPGEIKKSPSNSTGYIIFGGDPPLSGELAVSKILKTTSPPETYYLAQDGDIVRYVITRSTTDNKTVINFDGSFIGNVSSVDTVGAISRMSKLPNGRSYSLKKTDGTDILPNNYFGYSFIGEISSINSETDVLKLLGPGNNINLKPEAFNVKIDSTSQPDIHSPGILPGDIEHIIVLILVIIGSICLFSYAGYIGNMWFYMENGFYNSGRHVGIFIVLLIALILFGMFVEKPSEDSNH